MNNKIFNSRFWLACGVILAAAAMRLIPHWPNFTPIAAMALFGGALLGRKPLAFIIPLAAMFVSDLILGLHWTMFAVYTAFVVTVILGQWVGSKPKLLKVAGTALLSTFIFFIITNFGAWLANPMYVKNAYGLMQAYVAGLAFFNDGAIGISPLINSLLGDMFFNLLFFGAYYLASVKWPVLVKA